MATAVLLPNDKRQPHRRWYQFSLRTFLVLMLLVSVGLGWLGIAVHRGREQRLAVLAIQKLGGEVHYHDPSNFLQRSQWLRAMLGDEVLLSVKRVYLRMVSDADLVHLTGQTQALRIVRFSLPARTTEAGQSSGSMRLTCA